MNKVAFLWRFDYKGEGVLKESVDGLFMPL